MADIELDKWPTKEFDELYMKGRLELQPEYQRGRVWADTQRYDLIDTIMRGWPIGLVLLREEEDQDSEGNAVKRWDVVDGQQRITTVIEYRRGHAIGHSEAKQFWASEVEPTKAKGFKPYQKLSVAGQARFDEYKVSVARLDEYDVESIQEIYQRLQRGRPLNIGEKVKALKTLAKVFLRELTNHKVFDLASRRHKFRDGHWNLAAQFFKASYNNNPLERVEFEYLQSFYSGLKDSDKDKVSKASLVFHKRLYNERACQEWLWRRLSTPTV